jgi:hypothetical protein
MWKRMKDWLLSDIGQSTTNGAAAIMWFVITVGCVPRTGGTSTAALTAGGKLSINDQCRSQGCSSFSERFKVPL